MKRQQVVSAAALLPLFNGLFGIFYAARAPRTAQGEATAANARALRQEVGLAVRELGGVFGQEALSL
mgnify:CR=1 FL=1